MNQCQINNLSSANIAKKQCLTFLNKTRNIKGKILDLMPSYSIII